MLRRMNLGSFLNSKSKMNLNGIDSLWKRKDPEDKRIHLTPKGEKIREQWLATERAFVKDFYGSVPEGRIPDMTRVLEDLLSCFDRREGDRDG